MHVLKRIEGLSGRIHGVVLRQEKRVNALLPRLSERTAIAVAAQLVYVLMLRPRRDVLFRLEDGGRHHARIDVGVIGQVGDARRVPWVRMADQRAIDARR